MKTLALAYFGKQTLNVSKKYNIFKDCEIFPYFLQTAFTANLPHYQWLPVTKLACRGFKGAK